MNVDVWKPFKSTLAEKNNHLLELFNMHSTFRVKKHGVSVCR